MTLSEELKWRGFVQQTTFKNLEDLDKQKLAFYHGYDASADSQTIGNLAAMMFDRTLMRHGCQAVIVAGGATSLIGDPGGKDKERPLQDEATIRHNVARAEVQLKRVFAGYKFRMVNNLDWTKGLQVLDFLRDVGKHFSMTPLIQRDYIAQRLGDGGAGISYTEFSYSLLQGYDFLHLFDTYGVSLQLGGSDQWSNCLSGVDLIRRIRGAEAHVITQPLIINKATGKKFGKSEDGAVWLDETKTSVFKFYQFWLNVDDEGVEDYLKVYTEIDKPKLEQLMKKHVMNPSFREAQKHLAYEVTALVHGADRAKSVQRISEALFGGDYNDLTKHDFQVLKAELPHVSGGLRKSLVDVLVEGQLAASKSEARRFLESNAVYINGMQFPASQTHLLKQDSLHGYAIVRRGKNQLVIVELK